MTGVTWREDARPPTTLPVSSDVSPSAHSRALSAAPALPSSSTTANGRAAAADAAGAAAAPARGLAPTAPRAQPHAQTRAPAPEPRPGPDADAASASVSCRGTGGAARGSARGMPSGRSSSLRFRGKAGHGMRGEKTSNCRT